MKPTKPILIALMLCLSSSLCLAQENKTAPMDDAPPYIYVTPDMSKEQVDSLIMAIKKYDIILTFETLEYDSTNQHIKKVKGTIVHNGRSDSAFNTDEFNGLTIMTTKERTGVYVGIIRNVR